MKKRCSMSRLFLILILCLTALVSAVGGGLFVVSRMDPTVLRFLEAKEYITHFFVGEYEEERMTDAAITGMVEGLGDRWSYYLNAEGREDRNTYMDNTYIGLGVTISWSGEHEALLVEAVSEGGGAARAGLLVGDRLLGVDGVSFAGLTFDEANEVISGRNEGEKLTFDVLRADGTREPVTVEVGKIKTDPASGRMLEQGVGLVTLDNFYTGSAKACMEEVNGLLAQGATSLVIDLRNNPGGYVDELIDLLDEFMPEGVVFRSTRKSGEEKTWEADGEWLSLPLAVLVNRNTYSAAEFFAAALQEKGLCEVVGSRTFGKGFSQDTLPLSGGGALVLSTAAYRTAGGVSLAGVGVTPDGEVNLTEEQEVLLYYGRLGWEEDPQIARALTGLLAQRTGGQENP